MATGTAAEIAVPANGFAAVQATPCGPDSNSRPYIWAYSAKTASCACGVYNSSGTMISVGAVAP